MKIIDLLNKIANGEEVPEKIKYKGTIYEFYDSELITDYRHYYLDGNGSKYLSSLFDNNGLGFIHEEVEILDEPKEDKIEKLNDILRVDDLEQPYDFNLRKIWCQTIKNQNKINEIIDRLNNE